MHKVTSWVDQTIGSEQEKSHKTKGVQASKWLDEIAHLIPSELNKFLLCYISGMGGMFHIVVSLPR